MFVSQRTKNIVDRVLWAVGAVLGFLASNAIPGLSPAEQAIATAAGVLGGDVVSDVVAYVDTGKVPMALVGKTWVDARPIVQAEIAKLPAADQALANFAFQSLDAKLSTTAPPTA